MKTFKNEKFESVEGSDYETAILETGYGRFNYALLILTIPCGLANIFVTTALSLALPAAQCDLNLTILDKGLLNSSVYIGMISFAFLWGYMADTLGRRKLLIYGYFLNSICDIAIVFTQKMWYLMLFKVLSGCIMSGPFAIFMSFISEFHGKQHRNRIIFNVGKYFNLGNIFLPLIALLILPNDWTLVVAKNFVVLHSWQIFFLVCSFPSVLSLIMVYFVSESPKFLMSRGRNEEALAVFQTIFHYNTGKPKSEYPIKHLINELNQTSQSANEEALESQQQKSRGYAAFKSGWRQIVPFFEKSTFPKVVLVFSIQFLLLLGLNTLRLWMPQIFALFSEYEATQNKTIAEPPSLCYLLEENVRKSKLIHEEFIPDMECVSVFAASTYLQSVYIGIATFVVYLIAGQLMKFVDNRTILIYSLLVSGICGIGFYWVKSSLVTLLLASLYVSLESVCSTAMICVTVAIFPTSLRAMAVSLGMMVGRTGSMVGSILLPVLLNFGCYPPFLLLGIVAIVAGLLSKLLPETKSKALV